MSADQTDEMSPIQAVQSLTEIEGYDESLTARAFGLTLMVFAFAIAAIPISYAAANPWLTEYQYGSLVFGVLWMPWIVAAVGATAMIWSTHSISLGESSSTFSQLFMGIGFTILFFAVAVGVSFVLPPDVANYVAMGVAGGIFTVLIGITFFYLYRVNWVLFPLLVAGLGIVLANVFLHTLSLPSPDAGFTIVGFIQGITYFAMGWLISIRG